MNTPALWFFKYCCVVAFLLASSSTYANNQLELGVLDKAKYGYAFQGTSTNLSTADFTFSGGEDSLQLTLDTYDIDTKQEVQVLVNGTPLVALSKTNNNSFGTDSISIPNSLQINGQNSLQLKQQNPGWMWGVTNLLLTASSSPQLIIGNTHNQKYGFGFEGIFANEAAANFQFESEPTDLILNLDTFDIDTVVEVSVLVNGVPVGNLARTPNNAYGTSTFSISSSQLVSGTNTLSFEQRTPGWKWGIENLLLTAPASSILVIDQTDSSSYGFGYNGVSSNKDVAMFEFEGNGQPLSLKLDTYDIDTSSEVTVTLNGTAIGNLALTDNNSSGTTQITLPAVAQGSLNALLFEQKNSGWSWGISNILLSNVSAPHIVHNLVHPNAYGNGYSGALKKVDKADFTFDQHSQHLTLELDTFDIDTTDEISVLVNDVFIGYLGLTENNSAGTSSLLIPVEYQVSGINQLSFVQKFSGWRWGIDNIQLQPSPASSPSLSEYEMVFNDEFTSSTLDASKWNTGLLWGPYIAINAEEQLYVDTLGMHEGANHNPFELTGDSLVIRATPVNGAVQPPARPAENDPVWGNYAEYRYNGPGPNGPGYDPDNVNYLSGIITSNETFNMTHGYVESRVKLPTGKGLWPAFWLLNKHYIEDSPEIDIMEFIGQTPDKVFHTYHYFDPNNNWAKTSTPTFETTSSDWTHVYHTFGMAWSPREIVWYVDGVETNRITDADYKISKQSMYILANLAVGGTWAGPPNATTPLPAEYEIDYIRAYKRKLSPNLNLAVDYQLMFNDEFNGSTLDSDKWNTSFLWGPYLPINNEEQYYVDTNNSDQNIGYTPFTVSNGTLKIVADKKQSSPANVPPPSLPGPNANLWIDNPSFQQGPYEGAPDYTSGMITSYDSFKFVNGYAEIRAKVPVGDGLWPAFWLLNGYYIGTLPEIDIMENLGETPNVSYHTFHRLDSNGLQAQDQFISNYGTPSEGYGDDFHTFGVHWRPGVITWYVDGQAVDTYTENSSDNRAYQLMYVIANLAVGGNFNQQPTDPSVFPATFEIDYIRVYQEKDTP